MAKIKTEKIVALHDSDMEYDALKPVRWVFPSDMKFTANAEPSEVICAGWLLPQYFPISGAWMLSPPKTLT